MIRVVNKVFLALIVCSAKLFGQTLTLNSTLTNHSVDSYSRAAQCIKLEPGFKYGSVTAGATNLLNLNISSLPSYVNNSYVDLNSDPTSGYTANPELIAHVVNGTGEVGSNGIYSYR